MCEAPRGPKGTQGGPLYRRRRKKTDCSSWGGSAPPDPPGSKECRLPTGSLRGPGPKLVGPCGPKWAHVGPCGPMRAHRIRGFGGRSPPRIRGFGGRSPPRIRGVWGGEAPPGGGPGGEAPPGRAVWIFCPSTAFLVLSVSGNGLGLRPWQAIQDLLIRRMEVCDFPSDPEDNHYPLLVTA